MRKKIERKKDTWKRLMSLLVTAAMSTMMLPAPGMSAEASDAAADDLFPETTYATSATEETQPFVPNTSGVVVYDSSGKPISGVTPSAGGEWVERTVTGEDKPTQQAPPESAYGNHTIYFVPSD